MGSQTDALFGSINVLNTTYRTRRTEHAVRWQIGKSPAIRWLNGLRQRIGQDEPLGWIQVGIFRLNSPTFAPAIHSAGKTIANKNGRQKIRSQTKPFGSGETRLVVSTKVVSTCRTNRASIRIRRVVRGRTALEPDRRRRFFRLSDPT